MSDGNYNRNLLPYRSYASGVRAGRAQMFTLAQQALHDVLATSAPSLTEQERLALQHAFRQALRE